MSDAKKHCRLAFRLGAEAPKSPFVVFLHGFMGSPADWRAIAGDLSGRFDVVGIALPGHAGVTHGGETFAVTAKEIIDEIEQLAAGRRTVIVGYSMGGRFALYLALHWPHVFAGAFIESASPGITNEYAREARALHDDAHARALDEVNLGDDLERFLQAWYAAPPFDSLNDTQRLALVQDRLKNNPKQLAKAIRAYSVSRQPDLWEDLRNLALPMLVVCGECDHKYCRIAEEMAARTPRIAMQTILNCGHNVHLEQPDAYTKVLRGFLDGVL